MTTTPDTPSAPPSAQSTAVELAGLTPTDAARITGAIAATYATYAPNTLHAYAWAWRHWTSWSAGRGLDPLPATPAAVCAYLTERAAHGVSFGTISLTCCAIAFQHRAPASPTRLPTRPSAWFAADYAAASAPPPSARPGH